MSRLKLCGFFRELFHGEIHGPALRELMRPEAAAFEPNAVAYLRKAVPVATAPMLVSDVLDPSTSLGTPSLLTDGTWLWPSDLAHYVEKYHCELPQEFIDHMRSRNWLPPLKAEIDLDAVLADVEGNDEIIDMEKIDGGER